jgi:hypothetical protein
MARKGPKHVVNLEKNNTNKFSFAIAGINVKDILRIAMPLFWEFNCVDIIPETFKTVRVSNASRMAINSEYVKLFHRANKPFRGCCHDTCSDFFNLKRWLL